MNAVRILIVIVIASLAIPSYAVPVNFKLESDPFSGWEFAQHHILTNATTTINVSDADGDGATSFQADLEPLGDHVSVHRDSCVYVFYDIAGTNVSQVFDGSSLPFVATAAGESLVVELNGPSIMTLSLGQQVSVADGQITGLGGVVHVNPGITTALDLLAINVSALPRFTGEAKIEGLLTARLIPEPAALTLVLLSLISVGMFRRRR